MKDPDIHDTIHWECKPFEQLSVGELYAILQLRAQVFVVEQQCVYQDMDGKDPEGYHFMAWKGGKLVAVTRILPPGISYPEPSIGRVVVHPDERRSGLGTKLMERSIAECYRLFGKQPIGIGAQLYLKKFYESMGFVQCSEIYDEDGIDHIKMILPPT